MSPESCGLSGLASPGTPQQGALHENGGGAPDRVLLVSLAALAVGLAGAIILGILKLRIVRNFPGSVLGLMVFFQCALPMAVGAALMGASAAGEDLNLLGPGIAMFVVGAFGGLIVWLWRWRVTKAAQLLALTARSVQDNRSVFTASFLFQAAAVTIMTLTVVLACLALFADARLVRSTELLPGTDGVRSDHCVGHPIVCDGTSGSPGDGCHEDLSQVTTVPCCDVRFGGLGIAYSAGTIMYLLWATSLLYILKQFTISGTVAQWYFSPVGSSTSGNLMRSLRHGLGPQMGTLAFAAAVKNALDAMRSLVRSGQPQGWAFNVLTVFYCLIQWLVNAMAEILEVLTEYAVVHASLSGMSLMDSGREIAGVFKRHFGDAVAMWAFPETMLGVLVLFLTLVWTTVMGTATWLLCLGDERQGTATAAVSAGVFSVTYLVLCFFSGVILDATKAVFLCYCLDKEWHLMSRSDMHEAFSAVPLGKAGKGVGAAS